MANSIIVITGVNRGIGKGLLAKYLSKDNNTVIGACRKVTPETTRELSSLPKGTDTQLLLVPLSLDIPDSITEAVDQIKTQHGFQHIDLVISNAGICDHWGNIVDMSDAAMMSHFEVNTLGPLRLFQATASLLLPAREPRFVYVSSALASIGEIKSFPSLTAAYGVSKAAGNYLIKKIDSEHPDLIAFSIDPGLVQTDMGDRAAQFMGIGEAPLTVDQSAGGIIHQIETSSKAMTSGQFVTYSGNTMPW